MKKKLQILLSILIINSVSAQASNLFEVFEQSVQSNPTFLGAGAQLQADEQNIPIALSYLLPQLSGLAEDNYNVFVNNSIPLNLSTLSGTQSNFGGGGINGFASQSQGTFKFNSHGYQVQLNQALFNYGLWQSFQQSKTTVKVADAQYAAAAQTLIQSVATAYFNVLLAEDNLRYIKAEKRAVYRQYDQVLQKYKVGLVAITGVYQAQAEYDTIVAQEIQAKNDIINAKESLRAISGIYYNDLDGLKEFIPLKIPAPADVDHWVSTATEMNWTLQAARYTSEVAREEIGIQRAGNYPTLNAVGTYTVTKTGTTPSGIIDTRQSVIGLQLNLPVYQGGLVTSETKQAVYLYQVALDNQEQTLRTVVNDTHQSYNNISSGISKIKADRQAIISNESSLRSTIEAYRVGTETMLDVLQAQRDLFNAERDYSNDQYKYINSIIALKLAAGTLSVTDIREINNWLTSSKNSYSALRAKELEADPLAYKEDENYDPEKGLQDIKLETDPSEVNKPEKINTNVQTPQFP